MQTSSKLGEDGLGEPLDPGREFRSIAEAMPQLIWITDADGVVEYVNGRWVDYTGFALDALRVPNPKLGIVHPDDVEETQANWSVALQTGLPYEQKYRLRRASDGSYRWFIARAVPNRSENGAPVRWIGTATDIDEQERARDSLSFVVEAGAAFAASLDVETICKTLARIAIDKFADWCFVTLSEDGRLANMAMDHRDKDLVRYLERHRDLYPPRPEDGLSVVISTNKALLHERVLDEQIEAAARDAEHLRLLRLLKMQSVMIVPIAEPDGKVYGAISMVSAESGRLFSESDVRVAGEVAGRAAMAIANARILEAERRAAERLRFAGKVNQLLFESLDVWGALQKIAAMIADDIADACLFVRLENDALSTDVVVHRDPARQAAVAGLRGQRPLRQDAEIELAAILRKHRSVVYVDEHLQRMKASVWPYLAPEIEALDPKATVIVPLHAGATTYGALVACYSERRFDAGRDLGLLEELAARASIAVERAETLARERNIATTLQQACLPSAIPPSPGLQFSAVYLPAGEDSEVGGDWYDALELDDGSVVLSVGDVTGRGIQAAAIMSKVRHAMGMAPVHERDPAGILDAAGWFLAKRYPEAIVTAFVAIVSPDRRTVRFANAGHPPPMLRRGSEFIELRASGLPLGLRQMAASEPSESLELCEGDLLVLYTDGLIEARRDWEAGEDCLRKSLGSAATAASLSPANHIARSCLPAHAHDDVAILTVLVGDSPAWTFSAQDARAAVDARAQFLAYLRTVSTDEDFLSSAELVFGELLGNVVRHSPGAVEISLRFAGGSPVLHVIDSGGPFQPHGSEPPVDLFSEIGRGLFLIRQVSRDVRVEHVPNVGNHVMVAL